MDKIKGTLLYVCLQEPVPAYDKDKPKEWKASIAVTDEDFVDEFTEYAQGIDAKFSLKKVKVANFEEVYKVAPPEGAQKYVWVFTFRRSTELGKTGKAVPEKYSPRVMEKRGNLLVDITKEKLVGNGSLGQISLEVFTRKNDTSSIYLKNVLVTELVEYTRTDQEYNPGQEFLDDDDTVEEPKSTVQKTEQKEEKTVKATARKPKDTPAVKDDDVPF
jgi:hypothetical protein